MRIVPTLPLLLLAASLGAQTPLKSVDELRAFFAQNCVKCHGPDGSAHAADGKKLGGFDFTDAKKAAKETDADMVKTIRKGIFFGMVMPSFKDRLTEADAALLVKEVLRKAEKGKAIAP
ncbi:c-type cytochrome [Geothrix edaphica]|uniref:Cytochrome c domain-containing protein n=1 Tax=Geothrix edaphica TaxID=2927976 RepID=A0ABQ5PV02_9BACT|nr:c-type cytochrome [Geothrix edaphica]GLH66189.1 hypothetical protein GETHED_05530 [Geothrix edaphica]